MHRVDKPREEKIKKIAKYIYLRYGNNEDSLKNWFEAVAIYNSRIKYMFWNLKHSLQDNKDVALVIISILSLVISILVTMSNSAAIELNIRPYISVDMKNPVRAEYIKDIFYGNNIVLENFGNKLPASKISTKYYITTDLDGYENANGDTWFTEELGGFPSISFVVSGSKEFEPGFRSLSPAAKYYYFEAVATYEGREANKKYWFHIKKVFRVDVDSKKLYLIYSDGNWDRNKNFNPPELSSKEKVAELINRIKVKCNSKSN